MSSEVWLYNSSTNQREDCKFGIVDASSFTVPGSAGYVNSGTISVSGAGTPQTLNTRVGTVTMTAVADIAFGALGAVVINNSLVTASSLGLVSLQLTTAVAASMPRIESVVYGVGTITVSIRNSAAADGTGSCNYVFSFILFK